MHSLLYQFVAIALCIAAFIFSSRAQGTNTIFDFVVQDAGGATVSLSKYRDAKAIIIVNVASNCGYTYTNYRELIGLYTKYAAHGLEILAFPSNQFGEQEPAPNAEIQTFCSNNGVTFPVLAKVDVNGPAAIDLFKYLKEEKNSYANEDPLILYFLARANIARTTGNQRF